MQDAARVESKNIQSGILMVKKERMSFWIFGQLMREVSWQQRAVRRAAISLLATGSVQTFFRKLIQVEFCFKKIY